MSQTERELAQRWPLIMATCMGIISSSFVLPYYSIGALVAPVTEEFGWSRAQFQAAILFSSGLGALTSPIIGWLNDKYGPRRVALPSIIGLSLGLLTASQIQGDLWMLFLAYGMMALLGAGTIPVTWTRAIATSFFKRRGLALGLALTGTGICASVAPHYTVWLTDHYGWRGAYIGLALIPMLIAWPTLYFLFKPLDTHANTAAAEPDTSAALASGLTLGEAVRGYRFWVLLLSILFAYQAFRALAPICCPHSLTTALLVSKPHPSKVYSACPSSSVALWWAISWIDCGHPGWLPFVLRYPPRARPCSMVSKPLQQQRWLPF